MDYEFVYVSKGKRILLSFRTQSWPPHSAAILPNDDEYERSAEILIVNTSTDLADKTIDAISWLRDKKTIIHGDLREYVRRLKLIKRSCEIITSRAAEITGYESGIS